MLFLTRSLFQQRLPSFERWPFENLRLGDISGCEGSWGAREYGCEDRLTVGVCCYGPRTVSVYVEFDVVAACYGLAEFGQGGCVCDGGSGCCPHAGLGVEVHYCVGEGDGGFSEASYDGWGGGFFCHLGDLVGIREGA